MDTHISEIQQIIRTIADNFESALASGDAEKIAGFYTEDGSLLPPGSDFVNGNRAIKEYWQAGVDMGLKGLKLNIVELEQHDDTAIEMSEYTLSAADGSVIDSGKGITIWKNKEGDWKLHRDIWNSSLEQT